MVFPVVMYACESWTKKKAEGREKTTPVTKSAGRNKTNAHKPCDTEGGYGEPKKVHTSPAMQRPARGAETCAQAPRRRGGARELGVKCTQPCDPEGEHRGLREAHTSRRNTKGPTQASV